MNKIEVLDLIWNNTTDAIFTIAHDGSVHNANLSFEFMSGYELEELKGIAHPPYLIDMTTKEHLTFLQALHSGKNFPYVPTKIESKSGKILNVLASYRVVNNKEIIAVGMYKDFTEQRIIQEKLEEKERLYRMLVEHLPDTIIKLRNDKIEYINAAGLQLLGENKPAEVVGSNIWDRISSEQHQYIQHLIATMYSREKWQKPLTIKDKIQIGNGKEIYTEVKMIPIGTKENPDVQLVVRDITEKREYEAKLEYMAYHDPLTGLKNRRLFSKLVTNALNESKIKEEKIAILYIDLDEFKRINDNYGHDVGDQLLQQFTKRLQSLVRENDVLGRVGGDEFLVLLQGIKDERHVDNITKRMHTAFQEPYFINGEEIIITSSIGVSVFPEHGKQEKTLIYHADQALYRAKIERNKYLFYE